MVGAEPLQSCAALLLLRDVSQAMGRPAVSRETSSHLPHSSAPSLDFLRAASQCQMGDCAGILLREGGYYWVIDDVLPFISTLTLTIKKNPNR